MTDTGDPSLYYDEEGIAAAVARRDHRSIVGGLWEEIGQLQIDFLVSRGLKPSHKLIDIGCGALRAGVKLVRYLDAGNYFGTDISASLLSAGYEIELRQEGLTAKLPRSHLITDGEFDFTWSPVLFDFAMAQSLFTHLPVSFLRTCLERLHPVCAPAANFYASFFEIPSFHPRHAPYQHAGGVTSHGDKDPYHYYFSDAEGYCRDLPWQAIHVGAWNHPRSQHMIRFVRL